jgi:hypothetical protein
MLTGDLGASLALKGNPQTFRNGTAIVTPVTQFGVVQANATPINVVIKSGSFDGDATEAEADTNIFGRLITSGNQKSSIELSAYISQANLTAPFANGTAWPMTMGDYLMANITAGTTNISGMFMISKQSQAYDPNEVLNLDLTLTSHGFLTTNQHSILTGQ